MVRVLVMTLVASSLAATPAAAASYRVGVGEQSAAMFATPAWQRLGLDQVRYLVPWDWAESARQRAEVDTFMTAARAARQDVLATFTAHRGCFDGRRYARDALCRPPSARAYRAAFRAFDDRYPWVRTYAPWNEVNHISQPTFARPGLAVRYYRVLRRERRARRFRVMAADVLDTANMHRYLRAFLRRAPGHPRLWGLHNYRDTNPRRGQLFGGTRKLLRTVRGHVWLTETGGIVSFKLPGRRTLFRTSERRANTATKRMFRLARRNRRRIKRLYIYHGLQSGDRRNRFDAGLLRRDRSKRPAYFTVQRQLRSPLFNP